MKTSLIALGSMLVLSGTLGSRSIAETRPSVGKNQATVIEGVIGALSPSRSAAVVNGTVVYVSARTTISVGDKLLSFEDLQVGMRVRASGPDNRTSMTALSLTVLTK